MFAILQAVVPFATFAAHYAGTQKKPSPILPPELTELVSRVNFHGQNETEKYPGISFNAIVRFHRIAERRRKYLVDAGSSEKDRFSVYFDPRDLFTLSITDSLGEVYNVRIPVSDSGLPISHFVLLTCEIACRSQSTLLRISVNGREVGFLNVPARVEFNIPLVGATYGADIAGANGAAFDMIEFLVYTSTLTTVEREAMFEFFQEKPIVRYTEYRGTHWVRADRNRNLVQNDPALMPILKPLDGKDKI